jgi:hypothetical protein
VPVVEADGVPPPPLRAVVSVSAYDPDMARRLREVSVDLTGIRYDALG